MKTKLIVLFIGIMFIGAFAIKANTIICGKRVYTGKGGDVTVIECENNPQYICYVFNGSVVVQKSVVENVEVLRIEEVADKSTKTTLSDKFEPKTSVHNSKVVVILK